MNRYRQENHDPGFLLGLVPGSGPSGGAEVESRSGNWSLMTKLSG